MDEDLLLTEYVATKLCHDLSSPIGAINNGIELLELEPNDDGAMSLLQDNAFNLLANIRFYRYMFGKVDESGEMDLEKLRTLWCDFFKTTKLNFKLFIAEDSLSYVTMTGMAAKITSLALLIASQIGCTGGELELILKRTESAKKAVINIRSKRVIINEAIENFLVKGIQEPLSANNIVLYLMFKLANLYSTKIDFSYGGENAILEIAFMKV